MLKYYLILVLMIFGLSHQVAFADGAVSKDEKWISIALADEPPDLSSLTSTDSISFMVMGHTMEGLLTYNEKNELSPAIAERWEFSTDADLSQGDMVETKITFWLTDAAKWSDGQPVTAHDFVFAWRTVVAPKTGAAYASILFPIKNAEKINNGKLRPSALGVKAINDFQLEVTLEKPTPYFLSLTAFATYYPVREDIYQAQGDLYAAEASNMIYNGPFVLDAWVHGASLTLKKNPYYRNSQNIFLEEIRVPYITKDPQARYNLFKSGDIVQTGLDAETLKDALKQPGKIRRFLDGVLLYLEFNHRPSRLTANADFRRAIQAVLDPDELVNKIIGVPGNIPGESIFPKWLRGEKHKFRVEHPAFVVRKNIDVAKDYLAKAKKSLGIDTIPPLVFLTGDSPASAKEAEYFQRVLKRRLDIDLKIDKQIFKQRLAKMTAGEFDIVSAGWGPDFDDPITFGNLFSSKNANNNGKYNNPDYDHWVEVSENSADQKIRMHAIAEMQDIMIKDAGVIPLYERGSIYLQRGDVKGVVRRIFGGDPYYGYVSFK